jgi:uncharacterized protein
MAPRVVCSSVNVRRRVAAWLGVVVLAVGAPVVAVVAQSTPSIPRPSGRVSDFAKVIAAEDEARITQLIEQVLAGSRGEIAVVTLPDLAGREVGDVALAIGREWGEGFLPDAVAGDIRREATPQLREGAYGPGLTLVTARLAERYAAEFGFALDSALVPPRRSRDEGRRFPWPVLFFILWVVLNGMGRRRGRGGMVVLPFPMGGGGFGGGGFGGFGGGGGFSGGGSSGRF